MAVRGRDFLGAPVTVHLGKWRGCGGRERGRQIAVEEILSFEEKIKFKHNMLPACIGPS